MVAEPPKQEEPWLVSDSALLPSPGNLRHDWAAQPSPAPRNQSNAAQRPGEPSCQPSCSSEDALPSCSSPACFTCVSCRYHEEHWSVSSCLSHLWSPGGKFNSFVILPGEQKAQLRPSILPQTLLPLPDVAIRRVTGSSAGAGRLLWRRVTQSRLPSTMPRQLLRISKVGDSTASLSNPFQCLVTLMVKKRFLTFRRNVLSCLSV